MTGGELLKQLRKEKRLTQQDIAKFLRVDRSTIGKYETGESNFNVATAKFLAVIFNVNWTEFFEDSKLPCEVCSLGSRLNRLRIIKELSLETTANMLNDIYDSKVNKGMLSKWENNKELPSSEHICILAKGFEVSTDYLLGMEDYRGGESLKIKKISIEISSTSINRLDGILEEIKKIDTKYTSSLEVEITII